MLARRPNNAGTRVQALGLRGLYGCGEWVALAGAAHGSGAGSENRIQADDLARMFHRGRPDEICGPGTDPL